MIQGNFEAHAQAFKDTENDVKARLQRVTTFRESIEIVHTAEYENFLIHLFPVFSDALKNGAPQFVDGDEQKIRNVLLEILNRLPNNEVLRKFVPKMCRLVMHILTIDNEENAVICLRIIFDLHKNFSPTLESEVQSFIHFFTKMYKNLHVTVKTAFGNAQPPAAGQPKLLTKSSESFKVLTECPLIVMLLFQLYPQYVETSINTLIPFMIQALYHQSPLGAATGPQRGVYQDFIAAQVKTLSFLTYVLRGFSDRMREYQDELARCVIQLLRNCPTEAVNSRKELLVATRHILATEFRKGFSKRIDEFLDENILIGPGRASHEIVRPLAYSTLADLVHHVRVELTITQLSKVIYIFSRNVHDPTLPLSIQTASVRLTLNLVDNIYRNTDPENKGRSLLVRILSALVNKFETLKDGIPRTVELVKKKEEEQEARGDSWTLAYTPKTEEEFPEDTIREVNISSIRRS
jgi:transformation/transcription domain-associated protein